LPRRLSGPDKGNLWPSGRPDARGIARIRIAAGDSSADDLTAADRRHIVAEFIVHYHVDWLKAALNRLRGLSFDDLLLDLVRRGSVPAPSNVSRHIGVLVRGSADCSTSSPR
jgi:hypothetical protein